MHKFERDEAKGVRKNPGRNNLLIKEKTLTNVGVFFHMLGLPICMHKFEGSRIKVSGRIRERCHQSNRFFTLFHDSAFLLSYKAFLSPFRMTAAWKSS